MSQRTDDRYQQSLWYAWGRIDSGAYGNKLNTDHGFEFAREQRKATEEFESGQVSFLDSILDAWDKYVKLVMGEENHGNGSPCPDN